MSASLYETDLVRWSEEQAQAIRRAATSGTNLPLDWENIAEEIESLGRSQRSELKSRLATIVEHLLKLDCTPAFEPRAGWIETIGRERLEVEQVLDDNPSLRADLREIVERAHRYGIKAALLGLDRYGEATPDRVRTIGGLRYTAEQVTGDWLPPRPAP